MSHSQNELRQAVQATELTSEGYHTAFASRRRRLTLESLAERTVPVDLDTVATDVATEEEGVETVDDDAIANVVVSLHHSHLPKLETMGLLEYDSELNQIEAVNGWIQQALSQGSSAQ